MMHKNRLLLPDGQTMYDHVTCDIEPGKLPVFNNLPQLIIHRNLQPLYPINVYQNLF